MPSGIEVECVTDPHTLVSRAPAWRTLLAADPTGEWFAGPDWILPWLSHFGAAWSPAVHFVHRDGELIGVVPFCVRRHRALGSPRFELPHNSHTRRIGWLARGDAQHILGAVLRSVRQENPHVSLGFPHIEMGGPHEHALRTVASECGLRHHTVEQSRSATIHVSEGWDRYVATRDARVMRNLRRHLRRLSEADGWLMTHHSGPDGFDAAWTQLLEVEQASWKHAEGSSIPAEDGAEPFYRTIAQRFATTGALDLWLLHYEGRAVAHALAVRHHTTTYLLKNSFAETVRSHSPGIALVWRTMEHAARDGCDTYDLLGDDESWKLPLATHRPRYAAWTLYPAHHVRAQLDGFSHRVARPVYRALRDRLHRFRESPQKPTTDE